MLHIPKNMPPEIAQQIINAAAIQFAIRENERDKAARVLECDEAFREFERYNMPIFGPIVRASTYSQPIRVQEIYGWHSRGEPRRPVCMRGSRMTMIAIYSRSSPTARNGYCQAVFARCLRMSKATLLYREDVNAFYQQLSQRILLKHRPNQWQDRYAVRSEYLIGGRSVFLNRDQLNYLRKLYGIIRKTHKLDDELTP